MSELINGKRALSARRAQQVLIRLELTEAENAQLRSLMGHDIDHHTRSVDPKNYDFYADWRLQAITFAGKKSHLPLFKSELLKLFNRFSAMAEEEPKDELYRFSAQLFAVDFADVDPA